jgi:hypothetical protein
VIYTAHPYGTQVRFAMSLPKALALCRKHEASPPATPCAGFTAYGEDGTVVVAVLDGTRATLVHECTHAVLHVLGRVGIDPTQAAGEPMAYLLESMYAAAEPLIQP